LFGRYTFSCIQHDEARYVKDVIGMKVLDLHLVVVEEPVHERMKGRPESTLVEVGEHNHFIVPMVGHFALGF
jgi:hypothetical protein